MENEIKLSKDRTIVLKVKTDTGEDTGEYLTFDLEDIELPLRYQNMMEKHKKNKEWLARELDMIKKRQDIKGKKLLSKNQEDKLKAIRKFFDEETEVYNMFLGENGVQKLLHGKKIGWTSLDEIEEIIEKQILPHFIKTAEDFEKEIMEKYKIESKEVI